ncbi:Tol-Pal system beta propeller repeat protein TolB [Chitinimonas sp. BJB300]|uniref:Tol-Pal system beta propeller repeat protein TolB n=1 Tax=Chitinimonas sp. BJB300 TaxID=1559339 RepID=UPI000C0EDD36|nr:Tol-Pal system beta propeller repeat protein TolB [Chitinimonas sp. BJB300]PHV10866.1 Tol-Pal system beta propeller repeat protein TolB [Chitinimonas sp. BJB300]TSJ91321.1 Tol-Pal system protein TolB [Chitinimonas sp. BJB300]
MSLNKLLRPVYLLALLAFCAARAEVTIEVTGAGARQFPIAVADLANEMELKEPITAVIRADLARSGRFKLIDTAGVVPTESPLVELPNWRNRGADTLTVGSVKVDAAGAAHIRLRIFDNVNQRQVAGFEVIAKPNQLRRAAHQLADQIYELLTGDKGVFATRIAYVQKQGKRFSLQIADADGQNPQMVVGANEPIMSPSWSPDGSRLAYVSFERKKPIVFVQDLYAGSRKAVASFKGSNSAPAWSPDGRSLAVTLTLDGISQIYLIPAEGGTPRRLQRSPGIDTEPTFSPDGQNIIFTSDRGGSPQLYRAALTGGEAERISFEGSYNVSPHYSADGKMLTFVRRESGGFRVATLDLNSRQTLTLSSGSYDESPSFAPNGKLILYASEVGGRGTLATVSSDGLVKQRLMAEGDVREPAWGPYAGQLPLTRLSF